MLIINSQRSNASGMLVSTFKRLEATAIGDSSTNTTFACGFLSSSVRPITPLPQPRSTISPSRFSGRCCIKKRAPISSPVREKTFAWLWIVQSVPSSFQLTVCGASASGGSLKVQLIKRAFFHASVVVVGPSTFSNSSSVEVWMSRALAPAIIRVSGVTTLRSARSCCSSNASVFGTLISTTPGCCG